MYVEALPGSKIDGCSFIVEATGRPAIALSGRGKRLDKVLFALLHEVAHILLGHLDGDGLIVDEQDEASYCLFSKASNYFIDNLELFLEHEVQRS